MVRNRGFTLIELLAAMAILAVVSLMAVQSLSGALFQRDVMTRVDESAAELARALALLRHDLEAAAPLPLRDEAGAPLPAVTVQAGGFSLMRGGIAALPDAVSDGYAQVDWVVSADGVLSRRLGAVFVPLLPQVSGLSLTALGGELPTSDAPTDLPRGFALEFSHERYGPIRLVVAR